MILWCQFLISHSVTVISSGHHKEDDTVQDKQLCKTLSWSTVRGVRGRCQMPSMVSHTFLNSWKADLKTDQIGSLWKTLPRLLVDTECPKDDTKCAKQDASLKVICFKFVSLQAHVAVDVLNHGRLKVNTNGDM